MEPGDHPLDQHRRSELHAGLAAGHVEADLLADVGVELDHQVVVELERLDVLDGIGVELGEDNADDGAELAEVTAVAP